MRRKKNNNPPPRIIFEDESLLVVDKPAGLVTTKSPGVKVPTLEAWLETHRDYPLSGSLEHHSGLAHRLDKETSGLVLVGKTSTDLENLQAQFKQRRVEKGYLALVKGEVFPREGRINLPLGRSHFGKKKFGADPEGRPAATNYVFKKLYRDSLGQKYSLLEFWPKTGRTHQLRVHSRLMGYPIVADAKYAGRKAAKQQRKWCPRQFLHAFSLSLYHPDDNRLMKFLIPLPEDLSICLASLQP